MTGWPTKACKMGLRPKDDLRRPTWTCLKRKNTPITYRIGMMMGLNALFIRAYDLDMSLLFEDSSSARRFLGKHQYLRISFALGFLHLCDQKFCSSHYNKK